MNRSSLILALGGLSLSSLLAAAAFLEPIPQDRNMLDKLIRDGNYQDALAGFRRRALDPQTSPGEVAHDLQQALACLQQLGRVDEIDDLREKAIQAHAGNWRLLQAAAESYFTVDHQGFLVAGRFERGQKRGGGQAMNTAARDRVRALQLMVQALPLVKEEPDTAAAAEFFFALAQSLMETRGVSEAWRLQYLTDLDQLPDYEPGWYFGGQTSGAPVGPDGQPIYYHVPGSFAAAENDGQRWRWALARGTELAPARRNDARWALARFCQSQFGVQTLAQQGPWLGRRTNDDSQARGSTYALDTLAESETIARLATGIRRFTLPGEFNYLNIY
jgi:alpha-2-macroglobulin